MREKETIINEDDYCDDDLQKIINSVKEAWGKYYDHDFTIYDSFFSIGGNSIILMKVFNIIDRIYPSTIKLIDFFTYTNIYSISRYIQEKFIQNQNP